MSLRQIINQNRERNSEETQQLIERAKRLQAATTPEAIRAAGEAPPPSREPTETSQETENELE